MNCNSCGCLICYTFIWLIIISFGSGFMLLLGTWDPRDPLINRQKKTMGTTAQQKWTWSSRCGFIDVWRCDGPFFLHILLVVWNMAGWFFPLYWECHHPNWRSPSFFRGVGWNHQPDVWFLDEQFPVSGNLIEHLGVATFVWYPSTEFLEGGAKEPHEACNCYAAMRSPSRTWDFIGVIRVLTLLYRYTDDHTCMSCSWYTYYIIYIYIYNHVYIYIDMYTYVYICYTLNDIYRSYEMYDRRLHLQSLCSLDYCAWTGQVFTWKPVRQQLWSLRDHPATQ